jgi:hypothetical protein
MSRAPTLLGLLVALACSAAASAATVRVIVVAIDPHLALAPRAHVSLAAAPGERNVVQIAPERGGGWLVREAGAPLTGPGCVALDAGTARCAPAAPAQADSPAVRVQAANGDDRITVAPATTRCSAARTPTR